MAEGFMALRESTENLDRRTGGKPKVRGEGKRRVS